MKKILEIPDHARCNQITFTKKLSHYVDYAGSLLRYFIEIFAIYLTHNLIYIVDVVKDLGPLDMFYGFSYENDMQILKKCIRNLLI